MCGRTFFWILNSVIFVLNNLVIVLSLHPCDSSGYRDVEENTTVTFYCDQYKSKTATWRFKGPNSNTFNIISQCSPSSCEMSSTPPFSVTYISDGNSSLTSTLTSRSRDQAGGEYECDGRTCKLHIIEPAIVTKPTCVVTRIDHELYVQCRANITTVYSSRGQYACFLQVGTTHRTSTLNLQPTPSETSNTSNRAGNCEVTFSPEITGVYTCNVTVYPGITQHSSDSISISRPSPPEISCALENSAVTCTCSTDNLGQPEGRLAWYTGTNDTFDRIIIIGGDGVSSLTMTRPATQSDLINITMFRCVNQWIVNVTARTDFTVTPTQEKDTGLNIPAVAGGVSAAAVVFCAVILILIWMLHKRKRAVKKKPQTQRFDGSVQHNAVRSDVSMIARSAGESRDNPSFGAYESLRSADVGQMSVYSEMTHGSGPVYGNSATPET